jgi:alpha-mannosidase
MRLIPGASGASLAATFFGVAFILAMVPMKGISTTAEAVATNEAKGTFWLIPHTHWEGAVFKTREQYLEMGLPNILTAVRLLKEHPNYRFALDQVAYFKPFLERYPEEAGAFRRFVTEGRLQIVGGMNVMPDDNMPGGESFVRQLLYAKGYCREALGTDVKVGWLLDTFGHHAQMPQVLRLAGFNSFWFFRGVEDRNKMPSEFLWQGLDGTRIPAFWLPFAYGHLYGAPKDLPGFTQFIKSRYDALTPFSRSPDRVGLAGVDVSEPELGIAELVEQFNRQENMPFTLRIGVPTDFEAATDRRGDLPVITGERNPLFQGIYSSRIELKQRMRGIERSLVTAEKLSVLAKRLGASGQEEKLWRAWEPVLFNVTHDLASGVMTDPVYEDTVRGYDFSQKLANEIIDSSLQTMLQNIDSRGEGIGLVVFNSLGWERADVAEAEVGFAERGIADFDLLDHEGKPVRAQPIQIDRFQDGGMKRVKFAFLAREIPAMGYALFHVIGKRSIGLSQTGVVSDRPAREFENQFYRAGFDERTGTLTSVRLKANEWEALQGAANVVVKEEDHGDFWELYQNLDGFQNVTMKRPLRVPTRDKAVFSDEFEGKDGKVLQGSVFSEMQTRHSFGSNSFATRIRFYSALARIDFKTQILNQESSIRYRLLIPTSLKEGHGIHEIPFGAVERPTDQEFPAQNWIDWSDGNHGVALLNRGLPGNNISEGTMMLSLMRSTRIRSYGEDGSYERGMTSDTGLELGKELAFEYALLPHQGDWRAAQAWRAGLEFNNPLIVHKVAAHKGSLSARWGLLEVSPANVVLTALKPSKDGETVIRVYEASGTPTSGATIRVQAKVRTAREANLMEDSGKEVRLRNGVLQFDLRPFEIRTFKLP